MAAVKLRMISELGLNIGKKMAINNIDFHLDEHLVQVGQGMLRIFENGDNSKEPIELDALEISRVLKVASEQLDDTEDYSLAG